MHININIEVVCLATNTYVFVSLYVYTTRNDLTYIEHKAFITI